MKEQVKTLYPDLIRQTINRTPQNYEIIDFRQFLLRRYDGSDLFLSAQAIATIRALLIDTFKEERTCFQQYGTLQEVAFTTLNYYQPDVGISGPRHSDIYEPVNILQTDNQLILWNGYHRTFSKMISNNSGIQGYVLPLHPKQP
ncbi:MAG TPA: hypothetical protein VNS58_09030 [Puia sp.]|nr:hypothetical protein [Puia sp.]